MKRSKYNLLPYFIDDERSLAKRQAYVKSCEKFFLTLKRTSSQVDKRTSNRMQGSGRKLDKI